MSALKNSTTTPTNSNDVMSWKNLINNYYGLLLEVDFYLHKLYIFLSNNGFLDNTSVTIISDHGDMMSAHGMKQKGIHFEESTNIACIIYSPQMSNGLKGTKSNILGSLIDIAPTLETLTKIKSKSLQFLGQSLFNLNNGKFNVRTENNAVFNVYNSWMTYLTYFNFKTEPPLATIKVIPDFMPDNFYNYLGFFVMIVDVIDGKKYKLARYFNFQELLLYNFVFNPKLIGLQISKELIQSSISGDLMNISLFSDTLVQFNTLLTLYFLTHTFSFKELFDHLKNAGNNLFVLIFINSISNIVRNQLEFIYQMPGYYNSTYTVYNTFQDYLYDPDHNYYFFVYNLDNDPHEVTNLMDTSFPARQNPSNLALAANLNNRLNKLLEKYNIVFFDFIVPEKVTTSVCLNFQIFGNDLTKYTQKELNMLTSCFGLNKKDGDRSVPYYDQLMTLYQHK